MNEKHRLLEKLDRRLIYAAVLESVLARLADVQVLESTGSTNDQLMQGAHATQNSYVACVANQQTAGKGRNGSQWVSPPDANVYMSVATEFKLSMLSDLGGLSLACGVAVANWLSAIGVEVGLKWPNDIFSGEKKLAGFLVETRVKAKQVYVVVGVGINIRMPESAAAHIEQPWIDLTSVAARQNIALDRNELVGKLLSEMVLCMERFKKTKFASFAKDWESFDMLTGKNIIVKAGGEEYVAKVMGVADDHGLKVCVKGEEKVLYAADIKLKLN